jgi:hypothetical protein
MRHIAIPLDDLLVRVAFGRMSLFVPTHEVFEVALALSTAEEFIQNAHDCAPSLAPNPRHS